VLKNKKKKVSLLKESKSDQHNKSDRLLIPFGGALAGKSYREKTCSERSGKKEKSYHLEERDPLKICVSISYWKKRFYAGGQ